MNPEDMERVYKSAWHFLIMMTGVWEYKHNRSRFSKFLSMGLILFHADACICDAVGKPTTLQRLLGRLK